MKKLMMIIPLVFELIATDVLGATTKAWIIGSKAAIKLDVSGNTIDKQQGVDIVSGSSYLDKRTGNLYIMQTEFRLDSVINVYDIKTLKQKGQLDVVIDNSVLREAQLLIPNSGNLFYLRWMKRKKTEPEIIAYDATTFKPVDKYSTIPSTSNRLLLSEAGDLLYSLVSGGSILKINIFKTSNFAFKSSIDIRNFFTLGTEGGVTDLVAGKALVSEVITRTPQMEYFEYVYDTSTNAITPKIRTTLVGSDYLIPVTNKIALHEEQYVGKFKSMRLEDDYKSSGNIHIFDAMSGKKTATVKVNVERNGKFAGLTPAEDKMYFISYGSEFSKPMLHIIDLKNYVVLKTLSLPEAQMQVIFFEE